MFERFRKSVLERWSLVISKKPWWVITIAVAVAAASVVVTALNLQFQANRNDLLSRSLPWNQRFIEWGETFAGNDDLFVVVDSHNAMGEPDEQADRSARKLVDELGPRLAANPDVEQVVWGFDTSSISPAALRLEAMPAFRKQIQRIGDAKTLLASPTPADFIASAVGQVGAQDSEQAAPEMIAQGLAEFTQIIRAFTQRMRTPAAQQVDLMQLTSAADEGGWQYLRTPNDRFVILRVTPKADPTALSLYEASIKSIRDTLAQMHNQFPEVDFGITGIEVIDADETEAAVTDSTRASIIAAVLIAVLLVTAFASIKTPLLLMAALLVGIAWSFGFLTLTIGHLQLISVIFTVILLGLGVAFGIHIAARYELVRHQYADTEEGFAQALQDTFATVGPGIVTGAVTTAAAFCTTLLTDFKGVAEMGAIAAAGILLCLVAMCSVFPALLRVSKWRHRDVPQVMGRRVHLFEERWVKPFWRQPKLTLAGAAVLVGLSLIAVAQLRFDYNLLKLLPEGVSSVDWQRKVINEGDQSIWAGVSIVNSLDEARQRTEAFRQLASVGPIGGVGLLFPADEPQKLAILRDTRQHLEPALRSALQGGAFTATTQPAPDLLAQVSVLQFGLGIAANQLPTHLREQMTQLRSALGELLQVSYALEPTERQARLEALRHDYVAWRQQVAKQIDEALDTRPLSLADLPARLIEPYVAQTAAGLRLVVEAYPRLPEGVSDPLDPAYLGPFIEDLRTVDPHVTGVIVQIYESGKLIWTSYVEAGGYALLAVLVLVWLDFRSLSDAVLSLVPVASGFAVTFGVMELVGVQVNPANIIVLPLMFGIGVDAGVHIIHRYRQSPGDRPLGLTAGTGKGITLTSYTTMIGFGAMLIARHRGIASLGFVLMTGIGLTLLACWTIMPAWLELRSRARASQPQR